MLCSACQSIFRGPSIFQDGNGEHRRHHLTAENLTQAIRQNCYICTSLLEEYQDDKASTLDLPRLAEGFVGTKYGSSDFSNRYRCLRFALYSDWVGLNRSNVSAYWLVEPDVSTERCRFASNTASEPCWNLAKQWLSSCLTSHVRCRKHMSANPYHPTRVIEVAPLASPSDDELHLRIAGEHSPDIPYMTLSHRWGRSEFLKLTTSTYQRLRDGFSRPDTLSKKFQDAVTICQKLGVRYLWIDSLCIFQDSLEDWRCEAAQMGQVYGNSLCNIAATGALSDEEGCFKDRDGSLLQPCTIKSEWDNQNNKTWEIISSNFWNSRTNRAQLNQRGWVMQERWLSPRVLHYGRDQLLWECGELDACETYPGGLPKPLRDLRSGFKLDPELLKLLEYRSAITSDPDLLYRGLWYEIVAKYSGTNLTKGEDKLIAISGIAKRIQGLLDDEYLAGLWRKNLPFQLLWIVEHSWPGTYLHLTRPRPYRAPSWSWASVDDVVWTRIANDGTILTTILDAGVTPIGADSTGQIKDGFIRLNGRIYPAEVVSRPGYEKIESGLQVNSKDLHGYCMLDTQPPLGTLNVYYLPIRSNIDEKRSWLTGLILQPAAHGNGTYERIGVYAINSKESYSAILQSQAYKDESLYENADGKSIVLI